MAKSTPQFRVRIKLDLGDGVIGSGKAALLRSIEKHGSISAAARDMGLNYRRAWFLIETLNESLGQPVVETQKGGATGGGATLTPTGRAVVEAFETCAKVAEESTEKALNRLQVALAQNTP